MEIANWVEIVGTITGIALIVVLGWFSSRFRELVKDIGLYLYDKIKFNRHLLSRLILTKRDYTKLYGKDIFGRNSAERLLAESGVLEELRINTKADRAFVLKFHNGDYFNLDDPIWKMSCVYESCAPHIRFIGSSMQDMKISLYIGVVGPLMLGRLEEIDPAARRKPKCEMCPNNYDCTNRYTYDINVNMLRPSNFKQLWEMHGVQRTVLCNLKIGEHSIGILGLDYCIQGSTVIPPFPQIEFCQAAERIQYLLRELKK